MHLVVKVGNSNHYYHCDQNNNVNGNHTGNIDRKNLQLLEVSNGGGAEEHDNVPVRHEVHLTLDVQGLVHLLLHHVGIVVPLVLFSSWFSHENVWRREMVLTWRSACFQQSIDRLVGHQLKDVVGPCMQCQIIPLWKTLLTLTRYC